MTITKLGSSQSHTRTDGLQTLVLDLSRRVLRIAQLLFMGYNQSFIHLLNSNYQPVVTGFQCLGLGVMLHFLPSPKTRTEAQHWNPRALEPSVGSQNWVNHPQDRLLWITKCQHRLLSFSELEQMSEADSMQFFHFLPVNLISVDQPPILVGQVPIWHVK